MLHFQKKSIYLFDCQCIHKHPQGGSWSWSYGHNAHLLALKISRKKLVRVYNAHGLLKKIVIGNVRIASSCVMLHFQKKSIYLFDCQCIHKHPQGGSWSWSYGSWIYNYLFNQCLSPQGCIMHTSWPWKSPEKN
jgi:Leu/Phe-tRNA-protein transferase